MQNAAETPPSDSPQPRKRRRIVTDPTRDLSFCIGCSEYDRFVAFADKYKFTYREAVVRLLDLSDALAEIGCDFAPGPAEPNRDPRHVDPFAALRIKNRPIHGVCFLYTQSATVGGWWAVQEDRYPAYVGLRLLDEGDDLTVYADDGSVLWNGIIHQYTTPEMLDGSSQQYVNGMWVQWVQVGMDPKDWHELFVGHKRCLLKPASENG